MTTLHLVIVCVSVLAAIALVLRGLKSREPAASAQGAVLAGQIAAAIAGKQNGILRALLSAAEAQNAVTETLVAEREEHPPAPSLVGQTIAIRTRPPDKTTVRGICHADYADRYVLSQAVIYETADGKAAGGLVEVLKVTISTVQVIDPPAPGTDS